MPGSGRLSWVVLGGVALAAFPGAARSAAPSEPQIRDLLRRVNEHRERIGCAPLRWDARLAEVARRHSSDMVRRRFFAHDTPEGATPFDRMERAGIDYRAAAENIAYGQETGAEVFDDWMHSSGHRANLESCRYRLVGIGRFQDHWTLDLVQPFDRSGPRARIRQVRSDAHRSTRRIP